MRIITAEHFIEAVEKALHEESVPDIMDSWFAHADLLAEIDVKWVESHRYYVYDLMMHGGIDDSDETPSEAKLH